MFSQTLFPFPVFRVSVPSTPALLSLINPSLPPPSDSWLQLRVFPTPLLFIPASPSSPLSPLYGIFFFIFFLLYGSFFLFPLPLLFLDYFLCSPQLPDSSYFISLIFSYYSSSPLMSSLFVLIFLLLFLFTFTFQTLGLLDLSSISLLHHHYHNILLFPSSAPLSHFSFSPFLPR